MNDWPKTEKLEKPIKSRNGGRRPGSGRKKGVPNKVTGELKQLAALHAPLVFNELVRLAQKAESEAVRVAAIKELFDRAYGKAPQAITGENGEGPARMVLEVVTGVPRDEHT